jgi:hypothetical protein
MEIEYDKEIEVTFEQYALASSSFKGVCAFRKTETQYYIKLLMPTWKKELTDFLSNVSGV